VSDRLLYSYDEIIEKLHKDIETTELCLTVHDGALKIASEMWHNSSHPLPCRPAPTDADLARGKEVEVQRNVDNMRSYDDLVLTLVDLANNGNLRWKYYQVSLEMLALLVRHDVPLTASAVQLFTKNMVHQTLNIRKICLITVSAILKQQKRPHIKVSIDPYQFDPSSSPVQSQERVVARPGNRADNDWLLYKKALLAENEESYNKTVLVDKTHWGYYVWPKEMLVYAPCAGQPVLGRDVTELSESERVIYESVTDEQFVEQLIRYLTLEENKGKDQFHSKFFLLFKGLFRNYDDTVLDKFKRHVERQVSDMSHDTSETSQRCAAEIICGLVRGSKHWPYNKLKSMWEWLIPVLRTALVSFTVESIRDWGTCFATCSENRDPRRIAPLLELLMDNPLCGQGGSFADSSRLYLLQGLLAQQEWRVPELLHRLYAYLLTHLSHPYKNVRDRIGSTLVNLFLYDVQLPNSCPTLSPHRESFLDLVLPQFNSLLIPITTTDSTALTEDQTSGARTPVVVLDMDTTPGPPTEVETTLTGGEATLTGGEEMEKSEGESEDKERKDKISMFKTVLKWIQGTYSRMFQCKSSDIYNILPVACMLESETKDTELRQECIVTLTYLAVGLLTNDNIQALLDVIKQVSSMPSWHARVAVLSYLQVTVFYNLFLTQSHTVQSQIRQIVLQLIADEQVEVRELAGVTLGGFLHCGYLTLDTQLINHFTQLCSIRVPRKGVTVTPSSKSQGTEAGPSNGSKVGVSKDDQLVKRHAGVIGVSACVLAYPYTVPDIVPELLMRLSKHLHDPQPIQMTVKKTMATFKRTHTDNWQDHKQKFSDDQLSVLTELLVSPNYYA